ncbi:hypothetical protein V1524DRAFT_245885 [Lipomyces starkeyi]
MLGGASMIPLLFIKESYKPVILARRAKKRGLLLPAKLAAKVALKMVAVITLTRPVKMLLTNPVVSSLSIYSAVLLAFCEGLPYIFVTVYNSSIGDSGLVFLAIGAGRIAVQRLRGLGPDASVSSALDRATIGAVPFGCSLTLLFVSVVARGSDLVVMRLE